MDRGHDIGSEYVLCGFRALEGVFARDHWERSVSRLTRAGIDMCTTIAPTDR